MTTTTLGTLGALFLGMVLPMPGIGEKPAPAEAKGSTAKIVFVCEHGSVKSLMAMEWFNRMAQERRLPFRAISRSGAIADQSVPGPIVKSLREDGFDVSSFTPAKLAGEDLSGAIQIVSIGLDEKTIGATGKATLEIWTDIPPASADYKASRDALRNRIDALLTRLAETSKLGGAAKAPK